MNRILLLKKCLGEARWSSRHPKLRDKYEVFKILFRLRYLTEIANRGEEVATQKIFGYTVNGPSNKEMLYLFREIFMDSQYEFEFDKNEPKIIDCGANIGMAVLFFKKLFPESTIIAFEPNPRIFNFLRMNVESNKLKGVEIYNIGLSDKEGTMDFYVDESNSLISSIDKNRGGKHTIKINTARLSKFLHNAQFDLAKIDVEGAEWGIIHDLQTSGKLIHVNQYIFEYHHNMAGAPPRLSDFLKVFETNGFVYNIRTSFQSLGDFQDIAINMFRPK